MHGPFGAQSASALEAFPSQTSWSRLERRPASCRCPVPSWRMAPWPSCSSWKAPRPSCHSRLAPAYTTWPVGLPSAVPALPGSCCSLAAQADPQQSVTMALTWVLRETFRRHTCACSSGSHGGAYACVCGACASCACHCSPCHLCASAQQVDPRSHLRFSRATSYLCSLPCSVHI